jgi:hypothetical protein
MGTDYCGEEIPEDEPDDAEIIVWEVEPHPQTTEFDSMLVRSWQDLVGIMENSIEGMMERPAIDDLLHEPLVIKVRVRKMRKSDYQGVAEDE